MLLPVKGVAAHGLWVLADSSGTLHACEYRDAAREQQQRSFTSEETFVSSFQKHTDKSR